MYLFNSCKLLSFCMGLKTLYSLLLILQFNVLFFSIADVVYGHFIQIVFYTGTYYLFYNGSGTLRRDQTLQRCEFQKTNKKKQQHATAPPPVATSLFLKTLSRLCSVIVELSVKRSICRRFRVQVHADATKHKIGGITVTSPYSLSLGYLHNCRIVILAPTFVWLRSNDLCDLSYLRSTICMEVPGSSDMASIWHETMASRRAGSDEQSDRTR